MSAPRPTVAWLRVAAAAGVVVLVAACGGSARAPAVGASAVGAAGRVAPVGSAPGGPAAVDASPAPGGPTLPSPAQSAVRVSRLVASVAPWRLPHAVSRAAVVADGSTILVLGGLGANGATTGAVLRLDPASGTVSTVGALVSPVHDAAGAVVGQRALVFGGGRTVGTSVVQALAIEPTASPTRSSIIGRLPAARADVASAVIDGRAYLVGGWDGVRPVPAVLETADGTRFRTTATLPVAVRYPAVAAAGGAVWVFGGDVAGKATAYIQRIDLTTGHATLAGRLPERLSEASAVTMGGEIWILGGSGGSAATDGIWRFDPATGRTSAVGKLPYPVAFASAVVVGPTVYLVGGEGGRTLDTVVEMRLAS